MTKIKEYLKNKKTIHEEQNIFLHGSVPVYVKDKLLNDGISLSSVIAKVSQIVPQFFVHGLDSIYVGDFQQFRERGINAFYDDGSLYISNVQDDEDDMIDDIVH